MTHWDEVKDYIKQNPHMADQVLQLVAEVMDGWKAEMKAYRDNLADKAMLEMCAIATDPKTFKKLDKESRRAWVKHIKELHFPNGITRHSACEQKFYKEFIHSEDGAQPQEE